MKINRFSLFKFSRKDVKLVREFLEKRYGVRVDIKEQKSFTINLIIKHTYSLFYGIAYKMNDGFHIDIINAQDGFLLEHEKVRP